MIGLVVGLQFALIVIGIFVARAAITTARVTIRSAIGGAIRA